MLNTRNRKIKGPRKAQTFIEYALLITVTIGALLMMGNYLNRSLQGRFKDSSDSVSGGGAYTTGAGSGSKYRSTTAIVYEQRKGHMISTNFTTSGSSFAVNAAAEIPPSWFDNNQDEQWQIENELGAIRQQLESSVLGDTAQATMEGGESPIGDGSNQGTAGELSSGDVASVEGVINNVGFDRENGDIYAYNDSTLIDSDTGNVNEDDITTFDRSTLDPEQPGQWDRTEAMIIDMDAATVITDEMSNREEIPDDLKPE